MPKCILDGCNEKSVCRKLCKRHYWRVRYYERTYGKCDLDNLRWHGKTECNSLPGEKWRKIEHSDIEYEVSNYGRVREYRRGGHFECAQHEDERYGYLYVSIKCGGKFHMKAIHRLVAEAFVQNRYHKREVNHIDGNKKNNNADNLEWCTRSENVIHARHELGVGHTRSGARSVKCIDTGEEFKSMNLAAKNKGISAVAIRAAASGIKRTAGGMEWKFIV